MKTQHTPGPWTVHDEKYDHKWLLIMAGGPAGRIVANVNGESCPDISSAPAFVQMPMEANARLIASAPDLLEALIGIRRLTWMYSDAPFSTDCIKLADAGILLATGENPFQDKPAEWPNGFSDLEQLKAKLGHIQKAIAQATGGEQ